MITDELRAWGDSRAMESTRNTIHDIADRIDVTHEEALGSKIAKAISVGEDGTEFVSMPIKELSECYIELPKDADGEVIHVGDVMERGQARGRVIALMLSNYPKKWGGGLHWSIQLEGEHAPTALDGFFRHYKPPTVEDVLEEMYDALEDARIPNGSEKRTYEEIIAEYATKLQLKEDE